MGPANDRNAVGVVHILYGAHLFTELGAGVIVGTLTTFFKNDLAFRFDDFSCEGEIGHAVGFHFHYQRQAIFGNGLEIAGIIIRCESVIAPAIFCNNL